ncbi:winged-helix domain-containing protein [Chloroflexota bacterium]
MLIIVQGNTAQAGLYTSLGRCGFTCSIVSGDNGVMEQISRQPPGLVLIEIDGRSPDSRIWGLIQGIKQQRNLPTMALVSEEMLDSIDGHHDLDDFLTSPYDIEELVLRINRLLHRTREIDGDEMVRCDDLMIDLAKCEVTVEGRTVELTFKEYELLKFLASNKGRVYTREALLNKVWGYDYYGGDRTVDVHIRRLRSKIEDSKHTFIKTVRNIGYRFTKDM